MKAVKDVSLLWIANFVGAIAAFSVQILVARNIGVHEYGLFSMVISAAYILSPIINFGGNQSILKICIERGVSPDYISRAISFVAINIFSATLIIGSLLLLIREEYYKYFPVFFAVLFSALGQAANELKMAGAQVVLNYKTVAWLQISPHFFRFLLVVIIAAAGGGVELYFYAYIFVGSCLAIFIFNGFRNYVRHKNSIKIKDLLNESYGFVVIAISHAVFFQAGGFIIGVLHGPNIAADYGVAYTFYAAIYLIPSVLYQRYLSPKIYFWAKNDIQKLNKIYKLGNFAMFFSGVFFGVLMFLLSDRIINFIYGEKYSGAGYILKILSFGTPFMFLSFNSGGILGTLNNVKNKYKIMFFVANFSLIIYFVLGFHFKSIGVAAGVVISNVVLCGLYMIFAAKFVNSGVKSE